MTASATSHLHDPTYEEQLRIGSATMIPDGLDDVPQVMDFLKRVRRHAPGVLFVTCLSAPISVSLLSNEGAVFCTPPAYLHEPGLAESVTMALPTSREWHSSETMAGIIQDQVFPVVEEDTLNWEVALEAAPERPSGMIKVTLEYAGRGKPLHFEDTWSD